MRACVVCVCECVCGKARIGHPSVCACVGGAEGHGAQQLG